VFTIRLKQLQRQFEPILTKSDSGLQPEIKNVVNSFIFGIDDASTTKRSPIYETHYNILNQIDILGQIYSRCLSNLATEDPNLKTSQKLIALGVFGERIIHSLAATPISGEICNNTENIALEKNKFNFHLEQLKALKKQQNKSITNFEGLLNYILDQAPTDLEKILQLKTWNDLLDYVFGLSPKAQEESVKEIALVNIKELLLSYAAQGQLISDVFARYDALLAYAMSMLTMLSGSPYSDTFTEPVNRLLDGVGSATRMVLLQTRLYKGLDQYTKILSNINKLILKYFDLIANNEAVNPLRVKKILEPLVGLDVLNTDAKLPKNLDNLPGFNSMFPTDECLDLRRQLLEYWSQFYNNYTDILKTLEETKDYFDSMIKNANQVTADLFSKGFQAAIPLQDVETIEKVGLHIKNIVATSSSQKVAIPDEYFDTRLIQFRQFEEEWGNLQNVLMKKAHEEGFLKIDLPEGVKNIRELLPKARTIIGEWNARAMFTGYGEETALASRILAGARKILFDLRELIKPISKNPLSNENIAEYLVVIKYVNLNFLEFNQYAQLVVLLNDISKNLFLLNREFTFQFGKDEKYVNDPALIKEMIASIPQTLKIEAQQKLIPKELRIAKMKVYDKLIENVDKLITFPQDVRQRLPSYSQLFSC
jgi:hypothetical protein